MLTAAEIGLAAMAGVQNVVVYTPPRVHVVTSGDEVVEDDITVIRIEELDFDNT